MVSLGYKIFLQKGMTRYAGRRPACVFGSEQRVGCCEPNFGREFFSMDSWQLPLDCSDSK